MKKWLKNWWFSIAMWLFSVILFVYVIIAVNLFEEELLNCILNLISCITPIMLMTILGFANTPKKENKDE